MSLQRIVSNLPAGTDLDQTSNSENVPPKLAFQQRQKRRARYAHAVMSGQIARMPDSPDDWLRPYA